MPDAAPHDGPLTAAARAMGGTLAVLGETGGRFEAFARFQTAARSVHSRGSLRAAVARTGGAPWPRMWAVEGAAFGWARERLRRGGGAAALGAALGSAPRHLLLPLHTGVGMALAWRRAGDGPGAVGAVATAARRLARPGCAAALLEPLGFVVRVLRPHALAALVAAAPPELRPLLWHGGGRGVYFAPAALRSGGPAAAAFARAVEEAPPGAAREAALAGVGWALTLVHLRRPRLIALVLADQEQRCTDGERRAVLAGVGAALVAWTSVAGEERSWTDLLTAAPAVEEPYRRQHALWRRSGWRPLLGAPGSAAGETAAGEEAA